MLTDETIALIREQLKPHAHAMFRANTGIYRNGRPDQLEIDAGLILDLANEVANLRKAKAKRGRAGR